MPLQADTEVRRGPAPVRYQRGERAAVDGVPGPAEVADAVRVGPVHVAVDEAVAAVALAQLARHDGDLLRDRRDDAVPAAGVAARAVVVEVEARHEVARGIARLVRQPAVELVGVGDPARDDHLLRARAPNGVDQRLHPGRLVALDVATVTPAP